LPPATALRLEVKIAVPKKGEITTREVFPEPDAVNEARLDVALEMEP